MTYNKLPADNVTRLSKSLFLNPTDEGELFPTMKKLRSNHAFNADNITITPVKYTLDIMLPCETCMYILALQSGVFPTNMQIAKVSAIFKDRNNNTLVNYRPILMRPYFRRV